ncbi:nitrilase-related carbon-nitrogen hydrolase [Thiomicrorhabdus xiamenensis]|uniref:Carbon-nitrogen family hydrolase n=1 Tax=Thiomicrorhabdus xiamenensis TaxID=2739063 RepID=A0A7D4NKY4_9GAMM|nr:nitrilase-related carbon-nitrogen hydrolase [Thiomicrorhabdus xiamenensis]QKI89649.1 carbon-nitrogen family hydrolase [Thiomicrorhabdus xiamenensis]
MQGSELRLYIAQFAPQWLDIDASLRDLRGLLNERVGQKSVGDEDVCQLLLLPEMFASGFSMQPEKFAESPHGEVSQALSALAVEYHLNILAGVAQSDEPGQGRREFYNRALYLTQAGKLKQAYSKQRLFSYAGENRIYKAGDSNRVFHIACAEQSLRAAVFICYDLRFPELFRQLAREVEIVFVLANWPSSRQTHWRTLLKARAIENQCFVVGVNRVGEDENTLHYAGGSVIFNANGDCLLDCQQQPWNDFSISMVELQRQVAHQRSEFSFLEDL